MATKSTKSFDEIFNTKPATAANDASAPIGLKLGIIIGAARETVGEQVDLFKDAYKASAHATARDRAQRRELVRAQLIEHFKLA